MMQRDMPPLADGTVQFLRELSAKGRATFTADELDAMDGAQRHYLDATAERDEHGAIVDPLDKQQFEGLTLDATPIPEVIPPPREHDEQRVRWMRAGYALALADSGPTPTDEAMRARWATEYAERATRRIPA